MNICEIDGKKIKDRQSFHQEIKVRCDFPVWYGENLDALFDCLTDITEDTRIRIHESVHLEQTLGDYWKDVLIVFRDAQEENEHIRLELE